MISFVKKLEDIREEYDFLMGYHTGVPKKWYCGIENVSFIFMGAWSDPLLGYKGYAINEPFATDGLYFTFNEETGLDDIDSFANWLKENKELLFESLEYAIDYAQKEGWV